MFRYSGEIHVYMNVPSIQVFIEESLDCGNDINTWAFHFYSASAWLAMQSAVLARGILSVCLSVRLSVRLSFRHIPVFCQDE